MKPQNFSDMRSVHSMLSMADKVCLVTGAAGGIGRATAKAFAELGAKIILMDIPGKREDLVQYGELLNNHYGTVSVSVVGDICDENSVDRFIQEGVGAFGQLDIVHNNAGIGVTPDRASMSLESWNKIVDINLTGSFLVARACAEAMKTAGNGGSIVTTASVSATIINTGPGYAATKAGAKHMTAALAVEYAPNQIRLNSVSYGYILSGMHAFLGDEGTVQAIYKDMVSKTPMGRIGQLDEVVGAVIYLGSDLSSFQTGTDIIVDGGISICRL